MGEVDVPADVQDLVVAIAAADLVFANETLTQTTKAARRGMLTPRQIASVVAIATRDFNYFEKAARFSWFTGRVGATQEKLTKRARRTAARIWIQLAERLNEAIASSSAAQPQRTAPSGRSRRGASGPEFETIEAAVALSRHLFTVADEHRIVGADSPETITTRLAQARNHRTGQSDFRGDARARSEAAPPRREVSPMRILNGNAGKQRN
ncbi:MAG: hypothetical protein IPG96_20240 [Proteobacteria bacterium]|nr:hypothetical protein [Pseudomonadota bacterium]